MRPNIVGRLLVLAACVSTAAGAEDTPDPRRTPVVRVFQKWKDSVVYMTGPTIPGTGIAVEEFFELPGKKQPVVSVGSGFVVHESGYVLTNAHAVQRVISPRVTLSDGRTLPAELLACVEQHDLALLKVDAGRTLPAVKLADAGDLMIGETVVVIANPHGLLHTCTAGILSAVGRATQPTGLPGVTLRNLIQTDASINPGSSGGPWFNVLGQVIGITASKKNDSDNIGFAVSAASIRMLLPRMLDVERRRGFTIGLVIPAGRPCKVAAVADESPAAKAGIRAGDLLTKLDATPIADGADFHFALLDCKPRKEVKFELIRDGKPLALAATPRERPAPDTIRLLKQRFNLAAKPLDEETAKATKLRVRRGVVITEVLPGRYEKVEDPPRPGDILARIGGIRPRNMEHVGLLIAQLEPQRPVKLVLLRVSGKVVTRIDLTTVPAP